MKLYEAFAQTLQALHNTQREHDRAKDRGDDAELARSSGWIETHEERLSMLCLTYMPRGAGFDAGTTFSLDDSTPNRLVFDTSYHHMDENGFYCGWTDHRAIVTPSLALRFDVRVTGRNKRDIKDYISDAFCHALNEDIES